MTSAPHHQIHICFLHMPLTNQVKCIGYAVFQPVVHINLGSLSSTFRDSLFRMRLTLWPGGWGASWLCFDQQHCSFCRECGLLFDNFFVLLKSILQRWFSTFNTSILVFHCMMSMCYRLKGTNMIGAMMKSTI